MLLNRSHKAHFPGQNLHGAGNYLEGVLEKSDHKVQTGVEIRVFTRSYPGSCQVETSSNRFCPFSRQPSPMCYSESVIFSCIQWQFSLEQLVSLSSCPVTTNPCEESNPIFFIGTFWFPKVCAELCVPLAHRAGLCLPVSCALLSCFWHQPRYPKEQRRRTSENPHSLK